MFEPKNNIATVLEQLNDLSSTQIMLIQQINELRGRVKALESAHTGAPESDHDKMQKLVGMEPLLDG